MNNDTLECFPRCKREKESVFWMIIKLTIIFDCSQYKIYLSTYLFCSHVSFGEHTLQFLDKTTFGKLLCSLKH